METLQNMVGPPNTLLAKHSLAPNRDITDGINGVQNPGGYPQNMDGQEWYSTYHRKGWYFGEGSPVCQPTYQEILKQGHYGSIPRGENTVKRVSGVTHQISRDPEKGVALTSKTGTVHGRWS